MFLFISYGHYHLQTLEVGRVNEILLIFHAHVHDYAKLLCISITFEYNSKFCCAHIGDLNGSTYLFCSRPPFQLVRSQNHEVIYAS